MERAIKQTYNAIAFNLLIAALMIVFLFGPKLLADLLIHMFLNVGVGIIGLFASGYFIGRKMDQLIKKKSYPSVLTGMVGLFLILLVGILFGSSVGFLEQGLDHVQRYGRLGDSLFDYYVKPLFWILFFGWVPTLIVGGVLGYRIKSKN